MKDPDPNLQTSPLFLGQVNLCSQNKSCFLLSVAFFRCYYLIISYISKIKHDLTILHCSIGPCLEQDNCEAERTSLSTAKATSSTQGPQTCTEAATKYYNYTVNETDEEREHRLPTLPKATTLDQATLVNKLSLQSKITFFDAAIGSKNCARQQYFSNGLGTADQPLHHEQ